MKKIKNRLKHLRSFLKTGLFITVLFLVGTELLHLMHSVSPQQIQTAFSQLSPLSALMIVLTGSLSFLPMLLYDVILNRRLKTSYSKKYIFETSWAVNSMNNLIGFAGLVDMGLRYSFYFDDESDSDVKELTRILPFFLSGLSILSAAGLCMLLFLPSPRKLVIYWPVLFCMALYLPAMYVLTSKRSLSVVRRSGGKGDIALAGASLLDWSAVTVCFCLIGRITGIHVPVWNVIPLYLIAVTAGLVSMLPGGLGSFDLVMLSGLNLFSISQTDALVWILLFRLSYYLIPFVVGVMFFIKHIGSRINEKLMGIPANTASSVLHFLAVQFLRLYGVFLVLTVLIPEEISRVPLINRIDPIRGQIIFQFPCLVLGALFVLLARFVENRLKISLPYAVLLFVVTLFYINAYGISLYSSVFLVLTLIVIVAMRNRLTRSFFIYAWEDRCKDLLLMAATFGLLFLIGGQNFRLRTHLRLHPAEGPEHFFMRWLHLLLLFIILAVVCRLAVRIASWRNPVIGELFDASRFSNLLSSFGADTDAGLAFLGDKRLYWYCENGEDRVVFQFAAENNKCVVMGNPIGDPACFKTALSEFIREADNLNMKVIFYEANRDTTLLLHEFGYEFMKYGESALVPLAPFTIEGKAGKRYRPMLNKLDTKGCLFEILYPPHSKALLKRLKEISDAWLGDRPEKGFSLGYFSEPYLQLAPIAVVKNANGEIEAFANFLPDCDPLTSTIDLMRYDPVHASDGVMDYLFVRLLLHFKETEKSYFELGMAPLSNVGTMEQSFFQEKIAYLIYTFSTRFYSFGGLRRYKDKFKPIWQPRYVVYPKKTSVLINMITIFKLVSRKTDDR